MKRRIFAVIVLSMGIFFGTKLIASQQPGEGPMGVAVLFNRPLALDDVAHVKNMGNFDHPMTVKAKIEEARDAYACQGISCEDQEKFYLVSLLSQEAYETTKPEIFKNLTLEELTSHEGYKVFAPILLPYDFFLSESYAFKKVIELPKGITAKESQAKKFNLMIQDFKSPSKSPSKNPSESASKSLLENVQTLAEKPAVDNKKSFTAHRLLYGSFAVISVVAIMCYFCKDHALFRSLLTKLT